MPRRGWRNRHQQRQLRSKRRSERARKTIPVGFELAEFAQDD
jgi:hypothetical protein